MDNLYKEMTPLLTFLLPGFVSASIFCGFTSHPKPSQFERTVEALVFLMERINRFAATGPSFRRIHRLHHSGLE